MDDYKKIIEKFSGNETDLRRDIQAYKTAIGILKDRDEKTAWKIEEAMAKTQSKLDALDKMREVSGLKYDFVKAALKKRDGK